MVDKSEFDIGSAPIKETVASWDDYLRLRLREQTRELTLRILFNGKVVAEERCFLEEFEYAEGTREHQLIDLDTL